MNKRLKICSGKGFHVTFDNEWTVSVQFGPGNYCDNYDMQIGREDHEAGEQGSNTAECAIFNNLGEFVNLPFREEGDYDTTVSNRSRPEEILKFMNWASTQEPAVRATQEVTGVQTK